MIVVLFLLFCGFSDWAVSSDLCQEILHHICPTKTNLGEIYQDQHGNIYTSFCEYTKSKCRDASIELQSTYMCTKTLTVTPSSSEPFTASATQQSNTKTSTSTAGTTTEAKRIHPTRDAFNKLFCDNADLVICSFDPLKVCGSDGKTYLNKCDFAKANCKDINLSIAREGPCKTG